MVKEKQSDRQQRLNKFLQAVDAAQKLQYDIMKYGLEAAHLYCDDVDGDWLETWGEDEDGQQIFVKLVTTFLESDDLVAVRVRKLLKDKSLKEIAIELERALSLSEKEDQILAAKNILAANVVCGETNRGTSDEIDEIELLDLAEELLEKFVGFFGKHS